MEFKINCNYGVLAAEKRNVYTYGAEEATATCSETLTVELPENDFFKLYETVSGDLAVETADGLHYSINDVLAGNVRPEFMVFDGRKICSVELIVK